MHIILKKVKMPLRPIVYLGSLDPFERVTFGLSIDWGHTIMETKPYSWFQVTLSFVKWFLVLGLKRYCKAEVRIMTKEENDGK